MAARVEEGVLKVEKDTTTSLSAHISFERRKSFIGVLIPQCGDGMAVGWENTFGSNLIGQVIVFQQPTRQKSAWYFRRW
ncbi:hypothetical protein [Haloferula sp.]|uniref:hypothetical protein n=1 Tax=Haloferula sp. TaxID=2497595 RepID=UPI003C747247